MPKTKLEQLQGVVGITREGGCRGTKEEARETSMLEGRA